jgi:long-chain acyl-CoA synthetase
LIAVANPNKQAIESWAQQNDVSGDFSSLCENTKVKEYLLGELNKIAKEKKVCAFLI